MNKIKLISLLAAAAVMTGSVAMAETYSATGNGYHGEMTVNVTIEDGKITDVELGDNHETNVVIDRAFPVIRERILEANTADVDSVTAATFSSYAIKTAVADAMQQAGLEAPKVAMQNAEKTATERAAESCDIVIVGGGPAGLAAAVSAKQTNADKNVILVEKLDILSGNGKFDMNFFDMINTEAQKAAGNDEWVGEAGLAKFLEEKSSNGESAERIQVWANEEYNLDAWLRAMGVELNYNYGGTNHMAEDNQYSGEVIQAGLEKAAAELGVDVRTGTKGVDLVMEDGACKGVIVTNNAGETYTINATVEMEKADMTPATIKWSSNNTSVAEVDSEGVITAREVGNAIIKGVAGEKTVEIAVEVVENPNSTPHDSTQDAGREPEEGQDATNNNNNSNNNSNSNNSSNNQNNSSNGGGTTSGNSGTGGTGDGNQTNGGTGNTTTGGTGGTADGGATGGQETGGTDAGTGQ